MIVTHLLLFMNLLPDEIIREITSYLVYDCKECLKRLNFLKSLKRNNYLPLVNYTICDYTKILNQIKEFIKKNNTSDHNSKLNYIKKYKGGKCFFHPKFKNKKNVERVVGDLTRNGTIKFSHYCCDGKGIGFKILQNCG